MDDIFGRYVVEPFRNFIGSVLSFLPNLLLALLVLAAGLAASLIARFVLHKFLVAVGLDRYADKSGINDLLKRGGLKEGVSETVSRLVYLLLVVMFLIVSLNMLNLPQLDRLLTAFFLYLPSIFAAVAVMFVGYVLSNFFAKFILVSAVNAGWRMPGTLSKAVKLLVLFVAATMALEQLGIGRGTILIMFSILFGGLVLALAIAFGLGARELARKFLEKYLKEEKVQEKDEINHF